MGISPTGASSSLAHEEKPLAQSQVEPSESFLGPESPSPENTLGPAPSPALSVQSSLPTPSAADSLPSPTPVDVEDITGIEEIRYITVLPKNGWDYFLEFSEKEGATVAKCFSCFLNWMMTCIPDLSSRVLFGAEVATHITSFYSFFQSPLQITKCVETIVNCYDNGATPEKVLRAVKKGVDFLTSLARGSELLSLMNAVSLAFVKSSKNFCYFMIFLGSAFGLGKTLFKLYKKEWNLELNQMLYYGAKSLQDICYIVFPILIFVVGLGVSVPPLFILLVMTAGIASTIARFIIKRVTDPKDAMSRDGYRLVINTGQVPGQIAFGDRDSQYYKVYLRA